MHRVTAYRALTPTPTAAPASPALLTPRQAYAVGRAYRSEVLARAKTPALDSAPDDGDADGAAELAATWSGVIGLEGVLTGDGRLIEKNGLRWENLPIPLRWSPEDVGGHDGAQVVGMITSVKRDGAEITAEGTFDLSSPIGREASRQVTEGYTTGISMDLDDVSFEVRIAQELLDEGVPMDGDYSDMEADSEGRVTVWESSSGDEVMVTTSARVRAATIVAIPAFIDARIGAAEMIREGEAPLGPALSTPALVAGAAPEAPPRAWFADPGLTEGTPITVDDDGRVWGHLALWDSCHTAYAGQCVSPPRSSSGYAYFHVGALVCADGSEVAVGSLTMDTLHADKHASASKTLAHYEHTGAAVARVRVGEDAHGIWVAGAVGPAVTEDQVRSLRASPLSGDWRRIGGSLELVAALAVNVPGFPVPRPQGLVASGEVQSLVASGMLAPARVLAPGVPGALSLDDLRYLKRMVARERQHAASHLAERVARTRIDALARTLGLADGKG